MPDRPRSSEKEERNMSADAGAWRGRLKRDLHCHIDGSVSLPLLEKLAGRPVPKEEAAETCTVSFDRSVFTDVP